MTLADVSAALRAAGQPVSPTALAKAEVGTRAVKVTEAVALAAILDISVDLRSLVEPPDDLAVLREQVAEEERHVRQRIRTLSDHADRLESKAEALETLVDARQARVSVSMSQVDLLLAALGAEVEPIRRGLVALGMSPSDVDDLIDSANPGDIRSIFDRVPLQRLLPNLRTV